MNTAGLHSRPDSTRTGRGGLSVSGNKFLSPDVDVVIVVVDAEPDRPHTEIHLIT